MVKHRCLPTFMRISKPRTRNWALAAELPSRLWQIRSSAVAEDGAVNSFAGQYQTLLNVVGMDAVAAAIVECVEAAYRPHAAAYRKRSGASADEVNLAILVQEFIAADASAVAFTANPVTNDPSEIVINAYWGLGEGLVDGSSVPDTYTVDKRELRIKTRSVAKKEQMCAAGSTGVTEIDVPADNQFAANFNRRTGRRGLPQRGRSGGPDGVAR